MNGSSLISFPRGHKRPVTVFLSYPPRLAYLNALPLWLIINIGSRIYSGVWCIIGADGGGLEIDIKVAISSFSLTGIRKGLRIYVRSGPRRSDTDDTIYIYISLSPHHHILFRIDLFALLFGTPRSFERGRARFALDAQFDQISLTPTIEATITTCQDFAKLLEEQRRTLAIPRYTLLSVEEHSDPRNWNSSEIALTTES